MAKQALTLDGSEELQRLLKQLPGRANKRFWQSVARAGAKPIIDSARSKVPVKEGDLKRAIKYKNSKKTFGGAVSVGKGKEGWKQRMKAKVLAFGAKKDRKRKTRGSTGNIKNPTRDFIKEAGNDSSREALAIMSRDSKKFLEREIKKLL
jgi:HK97 gp10 family phage protein